MIRIETTKFEAVHGKKPKGNGAWVFWANDEYHMTPFAMTLTDAKRWLKDTLKGKGVYDVVAHILP